LVRSLLYLRPKRGAGDAIVDYYRRHGVLERALRQDGCLGAELAVPARGEGDIVVTALWRDAAAYEGWVANPSRAALAEELAALVEGELDAAVRGELYEVLLSPTPAGVELS
jgi:quinol monooxygenase YgiN